MNLRGLVSLAVNAQTFQGQLLPSCALSVYAMNRKFADVLQALHEYGLENFENNIKEFDIYKLNYYWVPIAIDNWVTHKAKVFSALKNPLHDLEYVVASCKNECEIIDRALQFNKDNKLITRFLNLYKFIIINICVVNHNIDMMFVLRQIARFMECPSSQGKSEKLIKDWLRFENLMFSDIEAEQEFDVIKFYEGFSEEEYMFMIMLFLKNNSNVVN